MNVSDPQIRLVLAGQALRDLPPEACLDWLETQGLGPATPPQTARPAIIAIVRNLCRQPFEPAWWEEMGVAAEARGRRDLVALCTEVEEEDQTLLRQTLDRELQEKTIGYRISHARTAGPMDLDRFIHDQEPRVIRSLLSNNKLTLQQVLRLVTRRPLIRPVVEEVIDAPKWSQVYDVHRSLARNDTVTHRVRLAHLLLLAPNDLHRLARDPMQSPLARQAARYRFIQGIDGVEYPPPRPLAERGI